MLFKKTRVDVYSIFSRIIKSQVPFIGNKCLLQSIKKRKCKSAFLDESFAKTSAYIPHPSSPPPPKKKQQKGIINLYKHIPTHI